MPTTTTPYAGHVPPRLIPLRPETQAQQANISAREQAILGALTAVLTEVMDSPAVKPISSDSYLPDTLINQAFDALELYCEGKVKPAATVIAPVCTKCKHAVWQKTTGLQPIMDLFCTNPKIGWRAGFRGGLQCEVERQYENTLGGCGARGRLYEAAPDYVEVAA